MAAILALACLAGSTPTSADTAPPSVEKARARELFVRGAALAREGRWDAALHAFEQSAAIHPHAVTSYNIGYCERALGRATRARRAFRLAIVQDAESKLDPDLRADMTRYLAEAEAQIAHASVHVLRPAVALAIDGRPLALGDAEDRFVAGLREPGEPERVPERFEVELDPGRHSILLSDLGSRTRVITLKAAPGARMRLEFELEPEPKSKPRRAAAPPRSNVKRGFAVGLAVAGGVGLGVGGYFAWRAKSIHDDAVDACPDRAYCPDDRARDLSRDARRYGNIATIAFVTGTAALGGATLLYVDSMESQRAHGLVVGGRF